MRPDLTALFAPRSIAVLGASERNPWTRYIVGTLDALGFDGALHLVNRRADAILGRASVASADAIGAPVDSAFVAVPAHSLEQTFVEMAQAGIKTGVVVSSGLAETGAAGALEERRLFDKAAALGLTLMGPNSLGFINFVDRVGLSALHLPLPLLPNPKIGVVSQSGATGGIIANTANAINVALTHVIAVGNEAMVDIVDGIDYLLQDDRVSVIAVFASSVRRPEAFIEVAKRALAKRKPIVLLKIGSSELAAQVAKAHTGALVGNDKVFDAICREYGILRVDTMEQLLQTSAMLAHTGCLGPGGFAVASLSGGACEMIADLGEASRVPFAVFAKDTVAKLAEVLPEYATVQNPLDVTGGVLSDYQRFEDAIAHVGNDPQVAIVAACIDLPQNASVERLGRPMMHHMSRGLQRADVPGFLLSQTFLSISDYGRAVIEDTQMPHVSAGLRHSLQAVAHAIEWSARVRTAAPEAHAPIASATDHPLTERETLNYLSSRGVPTISTRMAVSAEDAAAIAEELSGAVVLKIVSQDIPHKTDVGGVVLNVRGGAAAASEYAAMIERIAARRPDARVQGVSISPMREQGIELIVGVTRDPSWGLVLAVGIGGIWVELLADADIAPLPVTADRVEQMLGRLKASRLLDGYRGSPAVDRRRVAEAIVAIGDAALALGNRLEALEVNPLWASGDRVECLDGLAIWADG